jgi:hypothetical protein
MCLLHMLPLVSLLRLDFIFQ